MENGRKATEIRAAQFESLSFCLHFTTCFNLPDKGKAVRKLLKHLMSTFIKKVIERNTFSMPRGFVHV